jgi:hypothetical protein
MNGVEITPTWEQKLLNSLYPNQNGMEMKVTTSSRIVGEISYKTKKELDAKFQEVATEYEKFINPFELSVVLL